MTKEQAVELYNTKWWVDKDPQTVVGFQLFEEKLCMPFDEFQLAVEKVLGRPVWTHEFAFAERLQKEFLGERPAPTMEEILELIPESKRIIAIL